MKFHPIFLLLSITFLMSSCDLSGVQSDEDLSDNLDSLSTNDNTANLIENNLLLSSDSLQSDKAFALLKDTINGEINSMVYQREDGLRVEWSKKNPAEPITLNDVVMVNYTARVAGGEEFESNKESGSPLPLKSNIGMMLPGLEAGLLQMNVGDVGRIMIPNALAYGDKGYSNIVPPNADLIYEIEIVSIISPIVLDEGVKVYKWKNNPTAPDLVKDQVITFDYFAYTQGEKGHMYDNSFKDREPFSFRLENDNVVDGLHQGMKVLHSDENAFIEIPSDLAYGSKGLVDLVPKNTGIVYDVRILQVD